MALRTTNPTSTRNFYGVWADEKPLGRVRVSGDEFRAFTNRREPGNAFLGAFSTLEAAAKRVAQEHPDH